MSVETGFFGIMMKCIIADRMVKILLPAKVEWIAEK